MKKYDKEVFVVEALCLLYLFFRLVFMCIYNFIYTDEDQIVMSVGTIFISHCHLIDLMWLGQDYGSMLESLLALPILSLIISLYPRALLVIFCLKNQKKI